LVTEVAKEPVPDPVTGPVKVIVWSPVLVPLLDPEKLEPDRVPVAATELGVIAPRVRLMAGVVVAVATVPDTPFAVVTDTEVTVPEPLPVAVITVSPPLVDTLIPVPPVIS
jgi:hypothetical protein